MKKHERQQKILEFIKDRRLATVAGLSENFDVSEMTIRRDLYELDREGVLRRVHGGATLGAGRSYEPPYKARATQNLTSKQKIGIRAAQEVFDGESISLDIGSTVLEMIQPMKDRQDLTIITASLTIANEVVRTFSLNSAVRLILSGGILRSGELSLIGDIAQNIFRVLNVDKAFIGVGGISPESGLTEFNLEDTFVKRAQIASAREKYVLVDGSKFGQTAFASIAPFSAINTVITDKTAPADMVEQIRQQGIEVIVAD